MLELNRPSPDRQESYYGIDKTIQTTRRLQEDVLETITHECRYDREGALLPAVQYVMKMAPGSSDIIIKGQACRHWLTVVSLARALLHCRLQRMRKTLRKEIYRVSKKSHRQSEQEEIR